MRPRRPSRSKSRAARDTRAEHRTAWSGSISRVVRRAAGQGDYIELARRYHTVLVSNVPRFAPRDADKLRRFVWLVDEFYDRSVKLILSAAAPADALFDGAATRATVPGGPERVAQGAAREPADRNADARLPREPHLP
jgi:predicted ATPase